MELYDHDNDPQETVNLAVDSRYAVVISELKPLVKKNWPVRVTGGKAPVAPRTA